MAALTTLVGFSTLAPQAHAVAGGVALVALTKESIFQGRNGEQAGTIVLNRIDETKSFVAGEQFKINVADSADTANPPTTCKVRWSGSTAPAVIVANGTATVGSVALASGGGCTSTQFNQVVITIGTGGTGQIAIVAPKYDSDAGAGGAAQGPVGLTGTNIVPGGATAGPVTPIPGNQPNAWIALARLSFGPAKSITDESTGAQPAPDAIIEKATSTTLKDGTYCLQMVGVPNGPAPGFVEPSQSAGRKIADVAPLSWDVSGASATPSPAGDSAALAASGTKLTITIGVSGSTTKITISGLTIKGVAFGNEGMIFVYLTDCGDNPPDTTGTGGVPYGTGFPGPCGGAVGNANVCVLDDPVMASLTSFTAPIGGRLGGANRFATAELIAEGTVSPTPLPGRVAGSDCDVLLARGDLFPDALAGSYLAGSGTVAGYSPILLTNTDSVPPETLNAMRNLGSRNVYILGGTSAVSAAVATQLSNTASTTPAPGGGVGFCGLSGAATSPGNLNVQRIGGADRYETAKRVAEFPGLAGAGSAPNFPGPQPPAANPPKLTAILATGENFPDALAAGPMAFQGEAPGGISSNGAGFPLLLTNTGALNDNARTAIIDLQIQQVIIVGGTAAVADAVKTALPANVTNTLRLGGADRQFTAGLISTFERGLHTASPFGGPPAGLGWATPAPPPAGFNPRHFNLARGDLFPDSLTVSPHGGLELGGTLLTLNTTTLGGSTVNYLTAKPVSLAAPLSQQGLLTRMHTIGGVAAISAAASSCAIANLGGAPNTAC